MPPVHHPNLIQGSDEWLAARCGLLTASEMKHVVTPTLKVAANDKSRAHMWELLAQRITRYVEPHYVSDDMLRGQEDEWEARRLYAEHYASIETIGFITNDRWGFTLGYSPDALVGDDGLIECKSRRQKFQIETIARDEIPADFWIQVQTGLLVSERRWCDFVSYSGGLPLFVRRIEPCETTQAAIVAAASDFEARLADAWRDYRAMLASAPVIIPTERRIEQEMFV